MLTRGAMGKRGAHGPSNDGFCQSVGRSKGLAVYSPGLWPKAACTKYLIFSSLNSENLALIGVKCMQNDNYCFFV